MPRDEGKTYWLINSEGDIEAWHWGGVPHDVARRDFGNLFESYEAAKAGRIKVRKLLKELNPPDDVKWKAITIKDIIDKNQIRS